MNKPASPLRILGAGFLLAACLMALWFLRFGGPHLQTAPDSPPVSPAAESLGVPGAPAASGEPADVIPSPTDTAEPSLSRGVNGTTLYLRASALLKQLSAAEKKMIKQPREEVAEAEAKVLFEKLKPVLALIREAAGADYYNWGLGKPTSFDTPLPQVRIMMELAQAALWSAAYRFAEDPSGALEDLSARAQMPRSETNMFLIGGVVASSIEKSALEVIRENAVHLDASTLARARTFLAESTFNQTVSRAFADEAALTDLTFGKITTLSPEERLKWGRSTWGTQLEPVAEKVLLDPERLADEIRFIKRFNEQMAESVTWSDAQFKAWNSQYTARLADYPFAAMSLPALYSVRDTFRRVQVEREMLATGLAILSDGPAAAALARDPGTGNPFLYTTTSAGFELRSPTLDKKGRPMSMQFALPK